MILRRPRRKPQREKGYQKSVLADLVVEQDVQWFDRVCDVLDITFEFPEGGTLTQRYTFSLHPKSNLAKLIENLTGELPNPNEDYDASRILGKSCVVLVDHHESKNGDVWEFVKEVRAENQLLTGSL